MTALTPGTLLLIWTGCILLTIVGLGFFFARVIRTRQAPDQERLSAENVLSVDEEDLDTPQPRLEAPAEHEPPGVMGRREFVQAERGDGDVELDDYLPKQDRSSL